MIAASLNRLASAAEAGSWSRAEQARLEAYGIFELGPEQRLRGIAPSLFQRIEGLFWYGDGDHAGLVQLVKRKDAGQQLDASLAALDAELDEASQRVGSGAGSTTAVISNSAIVVFREGLEAVLILAALMASMVGANRKYRRPLLVGVAVAFVASALTWVRRADGARLARAVRREARGGRLGGRDRRAPADPQLVLPPRLLGRAPRRASTSASSA